MKTTLHCGKPVAAVAISPHCVTDKLRFAPRTAPYPQVTGNIRAIVARHHRALLAVAPRFLRSAAQSGRFSSK
jgi:hypothetical protein